MHPISNIRKFILDNDVKSIGDPFAGWGHRMIGTSSLKLPYIGCDINSEQVNNLNNIKKDFNLTNTEIILDDAIRVNLSKYYYDAIFTCPPYWNKEIYTNKGIENLNYEEYKIKLLSILNHWNTANVKIIGIQFTDKYEDIMNEFGLYEKIILSEGSHHLTKNIKKYNECIYIFKNR